VTDNSRVVSHSLEHRQIYLPSPSRIAAGAFLCSFRILTLFKTTPSTEIYIRFATKLI